MRTVILAVTALAIAGCNQPASAPDASGANIAAKPAGEPAGMLEPRINMAAVDPAKAKTVMHDRHEGMETIGKTMKQLSRAMKATPIDLAAVKPNAAKMTELAQKSANWFPAGTGPETGKTGAKAEIWQKPKDFEAKLVAWQKAATAFNAAAARGDAAAAQTAFGDLGKSCKSCHTTYRKDMH